MPTDVSHKTRFFTESVIREMTRRALRVGAVNLAQGFPTSPRRHELKEAAKRAIDEDYNQYAITHGSPNFRAAIAAKVRSYNKIECDADKNVTVTCGATEAMIATLLGVINPGDEVIIFEPFYENYGPDVTLSGAAARYVTLRDPDFSIDRKELEAAFTRRTKAIIINTPHNPTGKVFSKAELEMIAELCQRHDTLGHYRRDLRTHHLWRRAALSIASLPGMADRTVTISGSLEDLLHHRMAPRVYRRMRAADLGDSQGPRFPDRRRAASAAGGRGRCAQAAAEVLCRPRHDVRAQARDASQCAHRRGPQMPLAAGRVLHHRGHRSSGI